MGKTDKLLTDLEKEAREANNILGTIPPASPIFRVLVVLIRGQLDLIETIRTMRREGMGE